MSIRSNTSSVIATVLPVIVSAIALWWAWPDLPDPVTTHWDYTGQPDGFTAKGTSLILLTVGLPAALAVLLSIPRSSTSRTAIGARWFTAFPAALTWYISIVLIGSTIPQRNGGSPSLGFVFTAALSVALVVGLTLGIREKVRTPEPTSAPAPDDVPRSGRGGTVWSGYASTGPTVLAFATVPMLIVLAALGFSGNLSTTWFVLLAVVMITTPLVLALSAFTVTAGEQAVVIRGTLIGWPRVHIPTNTIVKAETTTASFLSYGGFGIRQWGNTTAFKTRSGTALQITRTDDSVVIVTCDDAETAAATINDLCDQRAVTA